MLGQSGVTLWARSGSGATKVLAETGPLNVTQLRDVYLFTKPHRITGAANATSRAFSLTYISTKVGGLYNSGSGGRKIFPLFSVPVAYTLEASLTDGSESVYYLYGIDPILCPCIE